MQSLTLRVPRLLPHVLIDTQIEIIPYFGVRLYLLLLIIMVGSLDPLNPKIVGFTLSWRMCKRPWGVKTSKSVHDNESKNFIERLKILNNKAFILFFINSLI